MKDGQVLVLTGLAGVLAAMLVGAGEFMFMSIRWCVTDRVSIFSKVLPNPKRRPVIF